MAFSLFLFESYIFQKSMWNQWIDSVWYFNHKTTIPQSSRQLAGKNRWAVSRTLGTQQQVSPPKGNSLSCRNCNFRLGTYLPSCFTQVGCSQREKARDTCLHACLLLGCFWWTLSSIILTHGKNLDVLQKRKLFQRRISNFCFWEVYWNGKAFLNWIVWQLSTQSLLRVSNQSQRQPGQKRKPIRQDNWANIRGYGRNTSFQNTLSCSNPPLDMLPYCASLFKCHFNLIIYTANIHEILNALQTLSLPAEPTTNINGSIIWHNAQWTVRHSKIRPDRWPKQWQSIISYRNIHLCVPWGWWSMWHLGHMQ